MIADDLLRAADTLSQDLAGLTFEEPVTHVYNPLDYAHRSVETYLRRFASPEVDVLLLGMNPGPWGMAQTGIPFGEIAAVRDWMGIEESVEKPANEHPKRPIQGFACPKSEVSGRRLWGLFSESYPKPEDFFRHHLVLNYCPLVFMEEGGKNRTPDKLKAEEIQPLRAACDRHLTTVLGLLRPTWLIGVGAYAEEAWHRLSSHAPQAKIGRILHPSPASPVANRGWAEAATKQLNTLGVWQGSTFA
ncbi:MAG: uracil-DNA glycosylase family protein [Verrucomicrobiota bacterium]